MKKWKPIFVENSRLPVLLSFFSPIDIGAITLGFIVFARDEMDETTRTHETIHFQQFLETLFIGFVLLYFYDWVKGYLIYRNGKVAYHQIRAEKEAYLNDFDPTYPETRKRWKWLRKEPTPPLNVV
tara:strand:+ start:1143 stop:1520 length:378 start_codon:yes stop_codon:yes gene_type:complete